MLVILLVDRSQVSRKLGECSSSHFLSNRGLWYLQSDINFHFLPSHTSTCLEGALWMAASQSAKQPTSPLWEPTPCLGAFTFWARGSGKGKGKWGPPWKLYQSLPLPAPGRDGTKPECKASWWLALNSFHDLSCQEWGPRRKCSKFGGFLLFSPPHIYTVGSGASTPLAEPQTTPKANDVMVLWDRTRSLLFCVYLRFSLGLCLSPTCLTLWICIFFFFFYSLAHISVILALAFLLVL